MIDVAAIALGMAVGGQNAEDSRRPVKDHWPGFVPLVTWPDGSSIGRAVGEALKDASGHFGFFPTLNPDILYFLYRTSTGETTSYATVERGLGSADDVKIYKMHFEDEAETTSRGQWLWFLFDYLGVSLDRVYHGAAFDAFGIPFEDTELYEAVQTDPEIQRLLQILRQDPAQFTDWEFFNGLMLGLGDALNWRSSHPRWPSPSTHWQWRFVPSSILAFTIHFRIDNEDLQTDWFLTSKGKFRSPSFSTFQELFDSHLFIPESDEGFDRWLDARVEPGQVVGTSNTLESWELLLGPIALVNNIQIEKYARSMGWM